MWHLYGGDSDNNRILIVIFFAIGKHVLSRVLNPFFKCTGEFQTIFSILRCRLWGSITLSTWNSYLTANMAKEARSPDFSSINHFLQSSYQFGSRKLPLLNDTMGRVWNWEQKNLDFHPDTIIKNIYLGKGTGSSFLISPRKSQNQKREEGKVSFLPGSDWGAQTRIDSTAELRDLLSLIHRLPEPSSAPGPAILIEAAQSQRPHLKILLL